MIYILKGHGLLYDFSHALCDAIFISDKEDKDRISTYAASLDPPQTWAVFLCYCASVSKRPTKTCAAGWIDG